MLVSQLIHTSYPSVDLLDKLSLALQLMDDYEVQHLPVLNDEKFAGIISKDEVFDEDENSLLSSFQSQFIHVAAKPNEHFLTALKLVSESHLSVLPVVNEQSELVGSISSQEIINALSGFLETEQPGGIIVLEMEKRNYSFGEISRLVETNDAYITQLNTTVQSGTGMLTATIKINKVEVSDIVATFQRYDYNVLYYFGEEQYANELRENYNHLISYLNI